MNTKTKEIKDQIDARYPDARPQVCPVCGTTLWAWKRKEHTCPPTWRVWLKDEPVTDAPQLVYAHYQQEAATKYAATLDQERIDDGDPPITVGDATITIMVQAAGLIRTWEAQEYIVWVDMEPVYKARQVWQARNGTD